MAHFGRGQTHAPIIRHGRVPPIPPVVYTDTCSGTIALLGSSVDYPSYSSMVLATSGLVSYWRAGEASGAFLDSKDSNPSTIVGGGVTRQVPGLLTSNADKAAQGDGLTGTYVNMPSAANMDVGAQLTLECWVKPVALHATFSPWVAGRMGSIFNWYIRHYQVGDARWEFTVYDTAAVSTTVTSPGGAEVAQVGKRQHLVMTYDAAGTMKAYIDGISVGTQSRTPNANVRNVAEAIRLFARTPTDTATFNGVIDEVAFYNTALTAQRVLDHYNAGAPPVPVTNNDAPSGTISLTGTTADSKSVADARSGTIALTGTSTDTKAVADSRTGTIALSGTRVESVTRSDTVTGSIVLSGTRVEAKICADSRTGSLALSGSATDNKVYTDARTGTIALSGTVSITRAYADSRPGLLALSGTASDNKTYTNTAAGSLALSGTCIEAKVCTDSRTGSLALNGTVTESYIRPIIYTDAPVGTLALAGTRLESKSVADTRSGTIALSGSAVDSYVKLITYTDTPTGTLALSGTCTSTHLKSYSDSATGTLVLSGTCTSTHVKFYTDNPAGAITLLGTRIEASVRTDSPTGLLKLLGTAAESLSRADSPTGVLRLSGVALDASSRTSTVTGLIRLSGSVLESASTANNFSDNPVGILTLSGTCTSTLIRVYNDSPTGRLAFSGTCTSVQSYSDSRTGTLALTGTATSTHAKSYSDNTTGTLALSGTCVSIHTRGFVDAPTGSLRLAGTAADSSQCSVAPVGLLKLSGNVGAAGTEHTDTCAGVLALIGVVSQTLAYVDQRTGRLILNGTAVDDHFIAVSDHVAGTLRLTGRATDSWAAEGRVDYDDYPLATLPLSGRLILPGVRPDDGIGRARIGAFETGRVVLNLTGRLSAPQTGRVVANLTGSLRR